MGRLWNKWLVPALFAVILFLCIRVANDIPKHEYYWESNEWNFMLKDMLVVLFMSYPIFFLLKYWLRLCRKRKLVWWQEYGVVVDGSRLVSSDDVGHPLFDGGKS